MPTNADWVRVVCRSDPYKKFAAKYPIDAAKIQKRLDGKQTPEPGSLFGKGLARAIFAKPYMPGVGEHVRTVMSSVPYKEWANYKSPSGTFPHRTDHNKLVKRLAGDKTTSLSSLLAQGLGGLLYQPIQPPPPPDDPPPGPGEPVWPPDKGFLHPMLQRSIVFTRSLSSFHGTLRQAARANGWSGIAAQFDHAYYTDENKAELARIRSRLTGEGWEGIGGWSVYGYENVDPFQDGVRHSQMAIEHSLDFWIANGEAWAESAQMWKSDAWIDGWLSAGGGGGIPVAVSCLSSNTDGWAREFDYAAFIDRLPGSGVFPQVYGATYDSYTVHNAVQTLKRGNVPRNRVGLTFDVINGQGPFGDYLTWGGPRSLWTGDDSTVETFLMLG